ncbi:hypothetical protein Tco_0415816 [Tanacetum coccineum]
MTEATMEEYMMRTLEDYGSGIARPKFDKDAKFELKGQFLKELREHTFSGSENEDANEHTERVLEILDLFTQPKLTPINYAWCIPLSHLLKPQAWERFKELLLRCPQHYLTSMQEVILFYKGLDVPTRQILDSKVAVPKMSATDAKKCGVPFPQAGRYRAAALGFYHRDNGNTSYQERRQTMEESLNKFMAEFAKKHDEHSSLIKEIRASTDVAIKNQGASIKALEIQIGLSKVLQEKRSGSLLGSSETNPRVHVKSITTTKEAETLKEDDKMPLIELSRATIPFPGRLKENGYDEKEVLKELKKLQVNSTKSAISLRILLKEKSRIEKEIKATMNMHRSAILKYALPPKE